jgi:hypothetical protein
VAEDYLTVVVQNLVQDLATADQGAAALADIIMPKVDSGRKHLQDMALRRTITGIKALWYRFHIRGVLATATAEIKYPWKATATAVASRDRGIQEASAPTVADLIGQLEILLSMQAEAVAEQDRPVSPRPIRTHMVQVVQALPARSQAL